MISLKSICLGTLRVYQASGFLLRARCRFWPTCSHYAYEAIETHGAARGLLLAFKRILRCRPFGGHGFDPVPEKSELRMTNVESIKGTPSLIRTSKFELRHSHE